ncbi:teichoic acid glycerol-phosphate primase TarB [Staphylococcus sp. 17KM0847]|uniref:teichoic acid glycerol-phosphate primase TarB n=1 Tax=Staphylococcus sp. 17KM0847 TaxID=2583989 RepID=UPI0015DC6195|nr:teichoic acid glycerol-phosphate primase TarB [Staphylococcus sp. 17KM0847]QLK85431.1 CDP-glycerol glycerophosphotransferase family protein [Staphylococcus sp. 17KM0847]
MIRFLIKKIYLTMVTVIQLFFKKQSIVKNHIVVLMTFKEDLLPVIYKLAERGFRVTVFTDKQHFSLLKSHANISYEPLHQYRLYRQLYALTTAKVIFIDNYYLLLGSFQKREGQTIIQTWHAAGALKKFGLQDHAVDLTQKKTVAQYRAVYKATDKYLVGSEKMAQCFQQAFDAQDDQLIGFGIPRLTSYWTLNRDEHRQKIKMRLGIEGKVAVYLPTYREEGEDNRTIDKVAFEQALPGYTLISKYHPTVNHVERGMGLSTRDLLIIADVVITDYSSLAIEASLLETPALFYVYDEQNYERVRGLNHYYYHDIPADYKVYNERELHQRIAQKKLVPLFKDWHTFNTKESLNQIVNYVEKLVRV